MARTELRRLAGDVPLEKARLRFRPRSVQDGVTYATQTAQLPDDYWGLFEVIEIAEEGSLPGSEMVRNWEDLAPSTQRRYLASKRVQNVARRAFPGMRARAAVRRWYEQGGDMRAARGHQEAESFRTLVARIETPRSRGLQLWIDPGEKKKKGRRKR